MDRVSKEAVSEGDATPSAIFQDAVEHQVSSSELSYAMDSYLQNREILAIEKRNPPSQSPNKVDIGDKNEFDETTIIVPRTEVDRRGREMKYLEPVNRPGLSELAPLKPTRSRSPSYQKARTMYDEAMNSIREELEAFQNFENSSSSALIK